MHVVATAGHVDHGKSTLVRALTGMEPDRWEEERRRGLTLDLGYAWTRLDDLDVALVDVPGHERFVPTMLAGVGPVPAVLLVVAADDGWKPQSQEHLDALAALGVEHGLLVVTRCDLADPAPATAAARERLVGTSLDGVPSVAVSAATGAGLPELRTALLALVQSLPVPDPAADVRLWVDRSFSIRGAGTVVTGTLPAGAVRVGDRLAFPDGREVGVRALQALDRPRDEVAAVSRVALNLRGVAAQEVRRGDALLTPGSHLAVRQVDVRLVVGDGAPPPAQALLHVGSASVPVRVRPLDAEHLRLSLRHPLPLRLGDRLLLRDPGAHRVVGGAVVLDVEPPALRRRGAARARADALASRPLRPSAADELERRGVARRADLVASGVPRAQVEALRSAVEDREWLVADTAASALQQRLADAVRAHAAASPLEPGLPLESVRQALGLPEQRLVVALAALASDRWEVRGGRLHPRATTAPSLPPAVERAVRQVLDDLATSPYAAPEAHRLRDLGLGPRELGAAVRAGRLARVVDGVYLAPDALASAVEPLRALPSPFTAADARRAWGTSRRVALPLLELLDARGDTRRLEDSTRVVLRPRSAPRAAPPPTG